MIRSCMVLAVLLAATSATAVERGASATVIDTRGKSVGTASFSETKGGVEITVNISGLPPGRHGIHIHERGACDTPGFATAGSHFNPMGKRHGAGNPQGRHAGDLPNLEVQADGSAHMTAIADGASLGSGPASLLGPGGTALVIHAGPDDEKSDPTGNSGDRIACGVIRSK